MKYFANLCTRLIVLSMRHLYNNLADKNKRKPVMTKKNQLNNTKIDQFQVCRNHLSYCNGYSKKSQVINDIKKIESISIVTYPIKLNIKGVRY